jgi:hypothetical protein
MSGSDPCPCPKCGSLEGWSGPIYRHAPLLLALRAPTARPLVRLYVSDSLVFTCRTCGYERSEPTKDTPPPPFPPNRVLKEGERPCRICGSGRSAHSLFMSHAFPGGWRWPWSRG